MSSSSAPSTASSAPLSTLTIADAKVFHVANSLSLIADKAPTVLFGQTGSALYSVAERHLLEKRSTVNCTHSPAERLAREEDAAAASDVKLHTKWKKLSKLLYQCWELSIEKGVVDKRVLQMKAGTSILEAAQTEERASKRKMLSAKEEAGVKRRLVSDVRNSLARITSGAVVTDQNLLGNGLEEEVCAG